MPKLKRLCTLVTRCEINFANKKITHFKKIIKLQQYHKNIDYTFDLYIVFDML